MKNKKPFVSVVITAGGSGKRFSNRKKKQYYKLNHKTILEWTILAFYNHKQINQIILTVPQEDMDQLNNDLKGFNSKLLITPGGESRQASVFNGLKSCPEETDIVLIHDAVRPFIYPVEISSLIEQASLKGAVIPVTKVKYTIKRYKDQQISKTINRDELLEVHTPQAFNYQMIMTLHENAVIQKLNLTDDAGLCESFSVPVYYEICSNYNIKITNPEDLLIAKAILMQFMKEVKYV